LSDGTRLGDVWLLCSGQRRRDPAHVRDGDISQGADSPQWGIGLVDANRPWLQATGLLAIQPRPLCANKVHVDRENLFATAESGANVKMRRPALHF
jgi:hypothetical protein